MAEGSEHCLGVIDTKEKYLEVYIPRTLTKQKVEGLGMQELWLYSIIGRIREKRDKSFPLPFYNTKDLRQKFDKKADVIKCVLQSPSSDGLIKETVPFTHYPLSQEDEDLVWGAATKFLSQVKKRPRSEDGDEVPASPAKVLLWKL